MNRGDSPLLDWLRDAEESTGESGHNPDATALDDKTLPWSERRRRRTASFSGVVARATDGCDWAPPNDARQFVGGMQRCDLRAASRP